MKRANLVATSATPGHSTPMKDGIQPASSALPASIRRKRGRNSVKSVLPASTKTKRGRTAAKILLGSQRKTASPSRSFTIVRTRPTKTLGDAHHVRSGRIATTQVCEQLSPGPMSRRSMDFGGCHGVASSGPISALSSLSVRTPMTVWVGPSRLQTPPRPAC